MKRYTTSEAAEKLGVHRVTLQRWIAAKRILAPQMQSIGGGLFRLWSEQDIERARKAIQRASPAQARQQGQGGHR